MNTAEVEHLDAHEPRRPAGRRAQERRRRRGAAEGDGAAGRGRRCRPTPEGFDDVGFRLSLV